MAVTQDQCGRVALLGSITGSMWASRSPWQQYRINVGESLSLAVSQDQCGRVALLGSNTGSMWASRPHSYSIQDQCGRVALTPIQYRVNVGESPTLLFNGSNNPRALAAHTQLGPPRNLPRGGSTGWTQIAEPRCAYAGCATPR